MTVPYSSTVPARITHNSQNAKLAVPTAVSAKSRLAQAVRFPHQTSKCIAASTRQADATMHQMAVIQLMA
jgi:hypothetical protein